MSRVKLDAWITGNYGEDHPDNTPALEFCDGCLNDIEPENMSENNPESICADCYRAGARRCDYCGELEKIEAMFSEAPPSPLRVKYLAERGRSFHLEKFCEDCREATCEDCKGNPEFCRSNYCMIPLKKAEALAAESSGERGKE